MTGRLLFFILCLTCFAFPIKSLEAKKGVRELIKDREKVPKKHGTPFPCHPKHLALINPHYEGGCTGMFSVFNYVIGCLDLFENGEFTGITLNFGEMGLYYEKKGPNWWNYYCEPISIGSTALRSVSHIWGEAAKIIYHTECGLSRDRVHQLISRYIHFKPYLLNMVNDFCKEFFFERPVIGVHYRGTDKDTEAKRVPYHVFKEEIEKYVAANNLESFLIYVATDEDLFLDYMIDKFPDSVIFIPAERSIDGQALHFSTENPYQQGLESLMDCLILSRTDFLIRTSSNLSLWSTY